MESKWHGIREESKEESVDFTSNSVNSAEKRKQRIKRSTQIGGAVDTVEELDAQRNNPLSPIDTFSEIEALNKRLEKRPKPEFEDDFPEELEDDEKPKPR